MNNRFFLLLLIIIILAFVIAASFLFTRQVSPPATTMMAPPALDPINATYEINGKPVVLIDGKSEIPAAPGSAATITTQIFGVPVKGDLNGDGKTDAAVFLVQDSGGSGTFYFAAAALMTASGTQGTNAVLLGDRIAPQTLEIHGGEIFANYADRLPGEPMSSQPSVGVTKYLVVKGVLLESAPPIVGAGEHCGGNMLDAPMCAAGYHCAQSPGSHLPFGDVGGICIAD